MPKTSTGGLRGGRALYRGKDAYAAQSFENDTRQSQLGGLFKAYLDVDTSFTGGVDTRVTWLSAVNSFFKTPFLRGFLLDSTNQYFFCRRAGTYRYGVSLYWQNLPATAGGNFSLSILRGANEFRAVQRFANPDGVNAGNWPVWQSDIIDLQVGDSISLLVNPGITATMRGITTTSTTAGGTSFRPTSVIYFEQIDLLPPA